MLRRSDRKNGVLFPRAEVRVVPQVAVVQRNQGASVEVIGSGNDRGCRPFVPGRRVPRLQGCGQLPNRLLSDRPGRSERGVRGGAALGRLPGPGFRRASQFPFQGGSEQTEPGQRHRVFGQRNPARAASLPAKDPAALLEEFRLAMDSSWSKTASFEAFTDQEPFAFGSSQSSAVRALTLRSWERAKSRSGSRSKSESNRRTPADGDSRCSRPPGFAPAADRQPRSRRARRTAIDHAGARSHSPGA